jgi:DNA repair exonuclease SbcCD ATPase subunit
MARLHSISIRDFRGIRSIDLNFKGKSCAILGQNGTGKSSVVDAVDFLATGKIRRLTGEGAGELRLQEHGCHVASTPGDGSVEAVFKTADGKQEVRLRRTLNGAGLLDVVSGSIFPSLDAFLHTANDNGAHLLTRREILQYILTAPNERARQINSVLQIGEIDECRKAFEGAKREAKKELTQSSAIVDTLRGNLHSSVEAAVESDEDLLVAVNRLRD